MFPFILHLEVHAEVCHPLGGATSGRNSNYNAAIFRFNSKGVVMKYARMIMEAEAPNLIGYQHMDYNLAESSVRDRTLNELNIDLGNMTLAYGHHFGETKLRELIARQSADNICADDVLVTAGAAGALFLVSSCLLEREDQIVVGFPNYATNFETPLAIGSEVVFHQQTFENNFAIDIEILRDQITDKTRFVSLTVPHNPTGTMISESDLRAIIALIEEKGVYLLFDETYRDLTYGPPLPVAASLSSQVISVGSMSKTWGVPGIRVGWLITRNRDLIETFVAGKEQVGITGSIVDEEIAYQILKQRDELLPVIQQEVADNLQLVEAWVEREALLDWVKPSGSAAALIRVNGASDENMQAFYETLKTRYRVHVAPGYWFKLPLNLMRIGFCWATYAETEAALERLSEALAECFDSP